MNFTGYFNSISLYIWLSILHNSYQYMCVFFLYLCEHISWFFYILSQNKTWLFLSSPSPSTRYWIQSWSRHFVTSYLAPLDRYMFVWLNIYNNHLVEIIHIKDTYSNYNFHYLNINGWLKLLVLRSSLILWL